ncbi:473_t:CDS:2, partial [Acaulospora colombiana]
SVAEDLPILENSCLQQAAPSPFDYILCTLERLLLEDPYKRHSHCLFIKLPSIISTKGVASARKNLIKSLSNESTSPKTASKTDSNKEQYLTHQRSCSMEPSVMTPEDNLNGIIPGFQRPPEICVDYLSHDWKVEDDIWTSWKVMSKQKKEIDNGVRLENASWRTWAKQKYKLKTVNPELLNWHKDSDVTWLYGPLHTAWLPRKKEDEQKLSTATVNEYNLSSGCHKSCLKKKSISEILCPPVKGKYPSLVASNSDTQLYQKNQNDDGDSDCDSASTCSSVSGPTTPVTGPTKSIMLSTSRRDQSPPRHHIRFNDQVEQCIAVDSTDGDDDQPNASDSESSSDDGLEMKISRKKRKDRRTIFKLAPTKLKYDRLCNNEYSALYTRRKPADSSNSASSTPPAT